MLTDYWVLSYGRWDKNHRFVVVINIDDKERELSIPVWRVGVHYTDEMMRILYADIHNYFTENKACKINNGILSVKMPPYSSMIFMQ